MEPYTTPSPQLQVFIDKTLRVTTTDGRFFIGELKCTDRDRNLILASTSEYRYPSAHEMRADAATQTPIPTGTVVVDLKSRFIGLVVVPGNVITKIEVEEGVRQQRGGGWSFGG